MLLMLKVAIFMGAARVYRHQRARSCMRRNARQRVRGVTTVPNRGYAALSVGGWNVEHCRVSAGRPALWAERGVAQAILPDETGPVGDLLLGQAGIRAGPTGLAAGSEALRRRLRRAGHRLWPFRLRRRPRYARNFVLLAARRSRGGRQVSGRRAA